MITNHHLLLKINPHQFLIRIAHTPNLTLSRSIMSTTVYTSSIDDQKRHLVKHQYHDHAFDDSSAKSKKPRRGPRGGVTTPFPVKLHNLLQENLHDKIISWQPHGRCFLLRRPKEFVTEVMPLYFKQSKLTSFQRQLNLYGFSRLTSGSDKGGYYHELFLRGKDQLCTSMIRMRIKGTRTKAASDPESEPNFYLMPPLSGNNNKYQSLKADHVKHRSSVKKTVKIERMTRPSSYNTEESCYVVKPSSKEKAETSPVCVSAQSSISSRSRSTSPMTYSNIGAPFIPIGMTSNSQTTISPRRSSHNFKRIHCYPPQPQSLTMHDISQFPEPFTRDDALIFEGKEFHYLDSMSLSFDEDIANSFDTQDTYNGETGLSVSTDGRFYGFDSFSTLS